MNGRVYDPMLGRFLSPDPMVQFPTFSQSWNRYSYVSNTPTSLIDPSGFFGDDPPRDAVFPSDVCSVSGITCERHDDTRDAAARRETNTDSDDSQTEDLDAGIEGISEIFETIDTAEDIANIITAGGIIFDVATGPSGEGILIGSAAKAAANKAIKEAFEVQLKKHGRKSLERSLNRYAKRLAEHEANLIRYREAGGFTSAVEKQIIKHKRHIEVLEDLLKELAK
jgi:uncharacterized protein RhaS with RHS repeats